jgi:HK97 family phage portal protein
MAMRWPWSKSERISEITPDERGILHLAREVGINTPGKLYEQIFPNETSKPTATTESAPTLSAVYRALNLAGDSLNLPINVYEKSDKLRQVVSEGSQFWPVEYLLAYSPNKIHTPSEWIRLMEYARLIYGNAYSRIVRNRANQPIALEWIHPEQVYVKVINNELVYNVYNLNGTDLVYESLPYWNMIHVRALSVDGIMGKSPIDFAAESLGFGLATQKAGNSFFAGGMRAGVIATHPGILSDAARERLSKSLNRKMTGLENTGKITVLEEGLKLETITITPEQAEFLASRKFTVDEVARWFGYPPHMLANLDKSSFNNIEHQSLEFIRDSVRPRVRMYEQEFNWKLLYNDRKVFTSFNINALMRADAASRAEFYFKMRQMKAMSANEVRALEEMNPYEGGDVYENPSTSTNVNKEETQKNNPA